MNFQLKLGEVLYIQKRFHFGALIGVEKKLLPQFGVEKALKGKNIITELDGKTEELSNEYRYLFSAWESMRYSLIRADSSSTTSLFCVLANEKEILLLDRKKENFEIEIVDFQPALMDRIITNIVKFDKLDVCGDPFNFVLPVTEATDLISSKSEKSIQNWSNKLGLGGTQIQSYLEAINSNTDSVMLLCEDHKDNIGSLTKIVRTNNGFVALKHVTPQKKHAEKMVFIQGDLQQIINSIYTF